jgi:putative phosphoesterase
LTVVAVIADTHLPRGTRQLPEECVERCSAAALILHLGDVVAASVLDELRALGPPVEAVYGNMDEPALRESLPQRHVVEVDGARIAMVHIPGARAGREARLAGWFPGCGAVVYGHTHVSQVKRHEGVWILNPGSPTERRKAPERSMLELEIEAGEITPTLISFGP